MPDGETWSACPKALCPSAMTPGSGPCTQGTCGTGTFWGNDLNTTSQQKSLTIPFQGMGPDTIVYIGYVGVNHFYDYVSGCSGQTERASTSSQDLWGIANPTGQSSRAAEVSTIQVVNTTNAPCGPDPDVTNDDNNANYVDYGNEIISEPIVSLGAKLHQESVPKSRNKKQLPKLSKDKELGE